MLSAALTASKLVAGLLENYGAGMEAQRTDAAFDHRKGIMAAMEHRFPFRTAVRLGENRSYDP